MADAAVSRSRFPLFAAVGVTAAALVWLAAGLRPDAFYSGDSGLKLIASLSAIAHPSRPLEFDLPRIGGEPVPYVEHMVAVHGNHGHVLQSPLFPLFSAPFIQAFGFRGAYLLPILSFIALVPLIDAIRRRATPETPFALCAVITIAANPVLFYALEYWEHAPAIALMAASLAAALFARGSATSGAWTLASGALGGGAVLLRPEAAWCLAGMLSVIEGRRRLHFAAAIAAVLLPFGVTNLMHSGTMLGPHASSSLAPLQNDWLNARWSRIDAWLRPNSYGVAAGLLLVAGAWVTGAAHVDLRARQILALLGAAVVAFAASERWPVRDSLWQAFPVALLALVPTPSTPIVRRLYAIVLVTLVAVVLTATHDGGAQWGPRFVLIATPPLLVLAARGAAGAIAPGRARRLRVTLLVIAVLGGVATTRVSYRELRGTKQVYGQIVSATSTLTNQGDVILTNVWWFDQVNAALYGHRGFLFVPTVADATTALSALQRAGTVHARLVWTNEPGGESLAPATTGTCFQVAGVQSIRERELQVATVRCSAR